MDFPRIGKPAPTFKEVAVLNDKVFEMSLSDYNKKYVVLMFYPKDFAYVCPTELIAYSDYRSQFNELNTEIIACSIESDLTHLQWLKTPQADGGIRGIRIPLIADKSMTITKKYGVLNEDQGTPYRASFIIDDEGILRHISVNDRPVGRSVTETIRLIKSIQYAAKMREIADKKFIEVPILTIDRSRSLHCIHKTFLDELVE